MKFGNYLKKKDTFILKTESSMKFVETYVKTTRFQSLRH